jgi:hypothetical protein
MQLLAAVAPMYCPAGQSTQELDLALLCFPIAHAVHAVAPASDEKVPEAQSRQRSAAPVNGA